MKVFNLYFCNGYGNIQAYHINLIRCLYFTSESARRIYSCRWGTENKSSVLQESTKGILSSDSITVIIMPELPVYPPLKFKNKREIIRYNKLVYNVKKTLPIAKMVNQTISETYEYLEKLPTKKEKERSHPSCRERHKKQYTPQMKKLTYSQGKLLIKLVDRECNQSSFEIVKAFFGPFKAGFYQAFASIFGASLKKDYDPEADDRLTERVVRW